VRLCERNNSADTKVSEEGEGGDAPGTGTEIPLQPMEKTIVRQAVPLQPMEVHGGAHIHLQPMEDPTPEHVDLKGAVTPYEVCDGAGSGQVLWPRGEMSPHWSRFAGTSCDTMGDPRWSSLFLKDCTPSKGPMLGQFMKNCSLWEGPTLQQYMENCLPWEGPHSGAGTECEESSPCGGRSGRDNVMN